jgi:DNA-binding GntR family transcriptional regulator
MPITQENIQFGGINLQKFHYNLLQPLDSRSKVPLSKQLLEMLSRLILDEKIIKEETMPTPKELSSYYQISLEDVLDAYGMLLDKEYIIKTNDKYIVIFHRFSHEYFGKNIPIIRLLEQKGYNIDIKKFPSRQLSSKELNRKNIQLDVLGITHEIRIDYYANDRLFAGTYEYVPKLIVDDIDQALMEGHFVNKHFKKHTTYLEPLTHVEAVKFSDELCELFNTPKGRAGMRTLVYYLSDQQEALMASVTYLTSWYELIFKDELT